MKIVLTSLTAASLILGLAACSSKTETNSETNTTIETGNTLDGAAPLPEGSVEEGFGNLSDNASDPDLNIGGDTSVENATAAN